MYLNLRGAAGGSVVVDIQHGRYIKLVYLVLGGGTVRRWKLEHVSYIA